MNIFVTVFLPMTIFVIMFSLGLGLTTNDFRRILTHPKAFAIGLSSQMILLPIIGFCLATQLHLPPELALGFVVVTLCPGGASANIFTRIARGDVALSISIMSVNTLLCAITMPLLAPLAARYFLGIEADDIDVTRLALSVVLISVAPLCLGMAIRHVFPVFATAIERNIARVALTLVVVVIGLVLANNWAIFVDNIMVLAPGLILLNVLMLGCCVLLARGFSLSSAQATAIGLEAGIKNGALGVAVGTMIANHGGAVSPVSIPSGIYGVTMYAVCMVFILWRRRIASNSRLTPKLA